MLTRRHFLASSAALAATGSPALAQDYPQRPVKVIVAFAPGGNSDSIARIACQALTEELGQSFVIENRGGAGGTLGAEMAARAAPDGYTLFVAATPQMAITPHMQRVSYDPLKDFVPIGNIGSNPFVMTVNAKLPIQNVKDFIDYVKARPGQVTFGSGGVGTLNHLSMMLFAKLAGIDITHVPYKGGGPAVADTLGGQVPLLMVSMPAAIAHVRAGKLRPLAVTTAARSEVLPDLPTVADFVPGYEASGWFGIGAPRNTPPEIISKLNGEINAGLAEAKIKARLADLGSTPLVLSPAEFGKHLADETEKWGKVIKFAGAKAD